MGMLASRLLPPPLPDLLLLLLERPGIARPWPELTGKIVHLTFRASYASYFVHAKLLTSSPPSSKSFWQLVKGSNESHSVVTDLPIFGIPKDLTQSWGTEKQKHAVSHLMLGWRHLTRVRR